LVSSSAERSREDFGRKEEGGRVTQIEGRKETDASSFSFSSLRRVAHNKNEFVPEDMFDDSTDLVIWGHEHDCRIVPEAVAEKDYWISQPGSSVATSLAEGEALEK